MSKEVIDQWAKNDWPDGLPKAPLPRGYEWVCLRPALGLRHTHDGTHPWWVRVSWKMKNGKKRILDSGERYFPTAEEAMLAAAKAARDHAKKRKPKQ